jgi:hypothetical protein
MTAYFQSPYAPDVLYEILNVNKEAGVVTVQDHTQHPFQLNLDTLKLMHWKIVKKGE